MIWIAGIYVLICGAQFAFTVWRDLKETKRRANIQEMTRQFADKAAASEARMASAIEGMRNQIAESFARKP